MNQDKILSLIEEILNDEGKILNNGEVEFFCPICNHYKRKLQINLKNQHWRCWICEDIHGTKGKSFKSFFKKFNASKEQMIALFELLKDLNYSFYQTEKTESELHLPQEYTPLWNSRSILSRHAKNYLYKRGLTDQDILKYRLGLCEEGKYRNRIIIPSFNYNGKLNYFTGRSIFKNSYPYLNPNHSKNIIGFELLINYTHPLILVEGPIDAMVIKRNVIPLFGKTISEKLKSKIITKNISEIYLALDPDAISKSIETAEFLMEENIDVHIINLKDKDPAEMGIRKFFSILRKTEPMNFSELIRYKMGVLS